jgi:hypothetical protein
MAKKYKKPETKANEKLKSFKINVDKNTDMFGKPQEIPVARDETLIKNPLVGTTYGQDELDPNYEPSDQTTTERVLEQVGQGAKYVGMKALEGMSNAVDGF